MLAEFIIRRDSRKEQTIRGWISRMHCLNCWQFLVFLQLFVVTLSIKQNIEFTKFFIFFYSPLSIFKTSSWEFFHLLNYIIIIRTQSKKRIWQAINRRNVNICIKLIIYNYMIARVRRTKWSFNLIQEILINDHMHTAS